jgi:ABC-type antimicrobial peptide transport system permease subunit
VFYLQYLFAELRRRPGRTVLTALGLALGVSLVVIVAALAQGVDDAQDEVLEPLTGVGTDLSVSRPIALPDGGRSPSAGNPFSQLSPREQRQLQRENRGHDAAFNYSELGKPGERFSEETLLTTNLSVTASEVSEIQRLDGAKDAAGSLTLRALRIRGKVPEGDVVDPHGPGSDIQFSDRTVSGIDVRKPDLAVVTPGRVTKGRYFSQRPTDARGEAVVDLAFARQKDIRVGDDVQVAGGEFKVVGLAGAPLGGDASDVYLELGRLQRLSDREGRVNRIQVRATSSEAVAGLARQIERSITGADVVTAADLADRVGGSLADADNLSSKLGTALAVVALLASFLIATLLTLSSVQKRTRELGTLKALGWRQRLVVRQVTGESLMQGALGGLLGAAVGVAGAAIIDAVGPTLEASVERQPSGFGPFGQGNVTTGSADIALSAPVDAALLVLAIGLAIVGGLLAGAAGGWRAARLRPAEALRSTE